MDEAAGRNNRIWKDWIDHPSYDAYWKRMQPVEQRYADIEVPIYGMGGWFDVFLQGTSNNFMGVRSEGREPGKSNQKVIIGPWIHSVGSHGTETKVGDMDFGHTVLISLRNECLRWFDYWLKGIDNGIVDEPSVTMFVMGANEWRTSSEWPLVQSIFRIICTVEAMRILCSAMVDLIQRSLPQKIPTISFTIRATL